MVSGLNPFWEIRQPWSNTGYDVGYYLLEQEISYGMASATNTMIYRVRLSTEDLVALKIIFPDISFKESVSK